MEFLKDIIIVNKVNWFACMNSKKVPVAHRVLPKSFCTREKSMPKFGFEQSILDGGEGVEAQI